MTTRNDNIKKINTKRELLSDEQLDQVSGGTTTEMSNDSKFLNVLLRGRNGQPDRYGKLKCHFGQWSGIDEELKAAWKSVGVETRIGCQSLLNKYYIDGKKVTQAQAWAHAEEVVGKHLSESDWNW